MMTPNKSTCSTYSKGWGHELHIENNQEYCSKLLVFHGGGKSSMHYHIHKLETWYIQKGSFKFIWIHPESAQVTEGILEQGDSVTIPRGLCHQLEALEDSIIFEASTHDNKMDNFRVWPGDSQK